MNSGYCGNEKMQTEDEAGSEECSCYTTDQNDHYYDTVDAIGDKVQERGGPSWPTICNLYDSDGHMVEVIGRGEFKQISIIFQVRGEELSMIRHTS